MIQDASVKNSVPSPKGQRIAVVVGVNGSTSFRDKPSLKHACDDASAIAEVLKQQCNFDVLEADLIGEDASSLRIKRAIFELAAERGEDDFLLFYFSGHGVPVDLGKRHTDVYLVSSDFNLTEVYREQSIHISMKWLREQLYVGTDAGHVLVILDCCHADGISLAAPDRTIEDMRRAFDYYLGEIGSEGDALLEGLRIAITATSYRNTALEDGQHGLMTKLILRALQGSDVRGPITPSRLFAFLQDHMPAERQPSLSGTFSARNCLLNQITQQMLHLPIPLNPLYRPRANEFENLEQKLLIHKNRKRLGLFGLPGIGKSELANQFAHRYKDRFPDGIFWLEASDQFLSEWQEKLIELAIAVECLPPAYNPQNYKEELVAQHFCQYLATHPGALLILDDVKDPSTISSLLQSITNDEIKCTLIYTSQNSTIPDGFEGYEVGALSEEDAQYLLVGKTDREKDLGNSDSQEAWAAQKIISMCEAHPLALMNFRGRCKQNPGIKLERLVNIVQSQGSLKALERFGKLSTSFQASWDGLTNENARLLFKLAAYYPEKSAIPLWLLGLAAGFDEQDDVSLLADMLQELSLASYAAEDHCLQLHSLWQEFGKIVAQEEIEDGSQFLQSAAERLVIAFEDLYRLAQYAQQGYAWCILRVQVALGYIDRLHEARTEQLNFISYLLGSERYFLEDSGLWPDRIPALFCQQLYNRSIDVGHPLKEPQFSMPWLHLLRPTGIEEQTPLRGFQTLRRLTPKQTVYREQIVSMAISSKKDWLLATSEDSIAWLWDASDETTIRHFSYLDSAFRCVTFNAESTMIALGTSKGEIILWSITKETVFQILISISEKPEALLDEEHLSLEGDSTIVNSEDENGKDFEDNFAEKLDDADFDEDEKGKVMVILFSPDSTKVLAGFEDGTAELWRAAKEEDAPLQVFKGHRDSITCIAFSEDGKQVCTGSKDGTARLWTTLDASSLSTVYRFTDQYPMEVVGLTFVPGGSFVLSSASFQEDRENTVRVHVSTRIWNIATDNWIDFPTGHSDPIHIFAFSPRIAS